METVGSISVRAIYSQLVAHLSGPGLAFVCCRIKENLKSSSKLNMHILS